MVADGEVGKGLLCYINTLYLGIGSCAAEQKSKDTALLCTVPVRVVWCGILVPVLLHVCCCTVLHTICIPYTVYVQYIYI